MKRRLASLAVFALCVAFIRPAAAEDPNGSGKPRRDAEIITRPARGERHPESLAVGDPAPDFTLSDPSGKGRVTLSDFRGKRPVVLIFGSFT